MRSIRAAFFAVISALAVPTLAAPPPPADEQQEPARPITRREPSAVDVVTTPMSDLNIRKGEIPQILIDAQAAPYSLRRLTRCSQIAAEVGRLDAALGDDIDIAQSQGRRLSPGKVAQSVVGGFIPFRGIIREISGANDREHRLQTAIYAGSVRRSFLKGVGQQRGCAWPARSATPEMLARIAQNSDARKKATDAPTADDRKAAAPAAGTRPRR